MNRTAIDEASAEMPTMYEGITPAPDSVFIKKLKNMDRKLDCVFSRVNRRFVVTYDRPVGDPAIIMGIAIDKPFRQPDERDLIFLESGDFAKESVKHRMTRTAKYMEDYRTEQARKRRENLRDMTKDGNNQLRSKFARYDGAGKGNSTFRRIERKPKGMTAAEIINSASRRV